MQTKLLFTSNHVLNVGDVICHKTFGVCDVISIDNDKATIKLQSTSEVKLILPKYASLCIVKRNY